MLDIEEIAYVVLSFRKILHALSIPLPSSASPSSVTDIRHRFYISVNSTPSYVLSIAYEGKILYFLWAENLIDTIFSDISERVR